MTDETKKLFLFNLVNLRLNSHRRLVTTILDSGSLKHESVLKQTPLLCHTRIEQALGKLWMKFLCLPFSHSFLKFINDF